MAGPTMTDYETYPGEYADIEGAAQGAAAPPASRIASALADCRDTALWSPSQRERLAADLVAALARLLSEEER